MKKYIVKFKHNKEVFGEYNSRKEASKALMEFINHFNESVLKNDYISPFDFVLEEVECKEVNEVITDFDSAKKYLVGNTNDDFIVDKERFSKSVVKIKKAEKLIKELNPKHIEALVALNRLFTIAEAWNNADGFVPDFSDFSQDKFFPWFEYNKYTAKFVCESASYTCTHADATFGHGLCFKTSERAEQFGKQFAELYNKVFL